MLLLHILLFDRAYSVTYWVNYSELRSRLRRRYSNLEPQVVRFHERAEESLLALRLSGDATLRTKVRSYLLNEEAPALLRESVDVWFFIRGKV